MKNIFYFSKIINKKTIPIFLLLICNTLRGQVANYSFSQSTGTYTAITGGTLHVTDIDDTNASFTIPFTFTYSGTAYTVARPTTNGFLVLGANAPSTTQYMPLSSGTTNFAIAAFAADLKSTVRSEVLGSSPNRIYVCQWSNVQRYNSSTLLSEAGNFQIRLYEGTNVIEIVYGSNTAVATSTTVQVGLRGSADTDFNTRTTTTNWSSTTTGGANNSSCTFNSTVKYSSGLTYTFTPPGPCVTPSAQATGFTAGALTSTTVAGSFTAATGTPTGYLVVRSPIALSTNPVDGTTYTAGGTLGNGTVIQASSSLSYSATGLVSNTNYVITIIPYNSSTCTGGSKYFTTSPLSGTLKTCPASPTAHTATSITGSTATIGWTASAAGGSAAAINYNVSVFTDAARTLHISGSPFSAGTSVSRALTGLSPVTTYYTRINANNGCDSGNLDGTFTTTQILATLPYTDNFNTNNYSFVNGTQTNKWVHGSATGNTANSMYISNDGGTTNSYTISSAASTVHAYREITVPSGATFANISFDWRANGEATFDYLRAWLVPSSFTPTAGTQITSGSGRIQLGVQLSGVTSWQTFSNSSLDLSSFAGTNMRLLFEWINDSAVGTTPPGAIDNVSLSLMAPCVAPTNPATAFVLGTVTSTSVPATFTAASPAAAGYLVLRSLTNTPPTTPANGTTYTAANVATLGAAFTFVQTSSSTAIAGTGLVGNTTYYYFIYAYNSTTCTGGPIYNTTVLTGNGTTLQPTYCIPTVDSPNQRYITKVKFVGSLNDVEKSSTFSTTPNTGYQNYTGEANKAIQAQGEGINLVGTSNGNLEWQIWVDWNKDGVFNNTNELIYSVPDIFGASIEVGFVIPATALPGDYRLRIRGTIDEVDTTVSGWNSCTNLVNGTIDQYGETEDYLFTVIASCPSIITAVTDSQRCNAGTLNLSATGSVGVTSFNWYNAKIGGTLLENNIGTFTTPTLTATTTYYVTAFNGTCESIVRTPVTANINPTPVITFTPSSPSVCGVDSILQISASGDKEMVYLVNENFETGTLGVFSNVNNDSNGSSIDAKSMWQNKSSVFIPSGYAWFPAISSNFFQNKFVMATSDMNPTASTTIENSLVLTNSINTTNFTSLNLSLRVYYSREFQDNTVEAGKDEFVAIEVSTNGGTTYPNIVLSSLSDIGNGTSFSTLTYNLNAYVNVTNLKFRIRHRAFSSSSFWIAGGVAIDDVKIYGDKPLNTSFNFDTTNVQAYTNASATTSYISGTPATTIYLKPTVTQLANSSFTIPVSAVLSNGCTASNDLLVNNNSKLWNGGAAGNWNAPSNWKPNGLPTIDNCVVIYNDTDVLETNFTGYAKNLTVKSTGNLNIASNNSIIVKENVTVETNGVFEIENNASLVQIDNTTNTGNITYKRIAPAIKGYDYVYWSSPVNSQDISTIYTSPAQGSKYIWNPTVANSNGGLGNWQSASGTMELGKGYIIRGSDDINMSATDISTQFIGVPRNGNITYTVTRGAYTGNNYNGTNGTQITKFDDNHNLIGNPYPSAIKANDFINANAFHATTNPTGQLLGTVKLWQHGTAPASNATNPFYGSEMFNYIASDYLTINGTGTIPYAGNEIIKAGQGFFVTMVDGTAGNGTVNFNNSMRLDGGNSIDNSGFFRMANESTNNETNRIWLNLVNAQNNNVISTILVGYLNNATNGYDNLYDGKTKLQPNNGLFSRIDNELYEIQGKAPFTVTDEVPLAYQISNSGNYTLAIQALDGLFLSNQDIYIKDNLLNTYHNIKQSPYTFDSVNGVFENRFKIVYQNPLDTKNPEIETVNIYKNANVVFANTKDTIKSVKIIDISGRVLVEKNNVNNTQFSYNTEQFAQGVLIIQVTTEDGKVSTKKVL